MAEEIEIVYKGSPYRYKVLRSNNSIDRVDFLLQPLSPDNNEAKKLINANELWFTWRKELRQFFTTNIKVVLQQELFNSFCNAIMKHYVGEHNNSRSRSEPEIL
jgi:hypothetical protein